MDFYCAEARLAVEIDGSVHQHRREQDALRTMFLEKQGLRVSRFTNEQVRDDLEGVVQRITKVVADLSPDLRSSPSPHAERGIKGAR